MIMKLLLTNHIFLDKMKVNELIKQLKKYPKDANVIFWTGGANDLEIGNLNFFPEENLVSIEELGCLGEDDLIYIGNDDTEG